MALLSAVQTHADMSHLPVLPPNGRGSGMIFSGSVVYISLNYTTLLEILVLPGTDRPAQSTT